MAAGCYTEPSPPDTRPVPDVVGKSWPDAAKRIGAAGLCFDWGTVRVSASGTRVGRVTQQRPRAGARVRPLTRVRIDILTTADGELRLEPIYLFELDEDCPMPGLPRLAGFE
jgi:beta-lactam-binding protein with PASTA domain